MFHVAYRHAVTPGEKCSDTPRIGLSDLVYAGSGGLRGWVPYLEGFANRSCPTVSRLVKSTAIFRVLHAVGQLITKIGSGVKNVFGTEHCDHGHRIYHRS